MMKKNLFVLLLALILPLSFVCAENYPYRSDVLWVTVPNHADWIYKTGEKATVEVQFYKYGIPQDGVTVSYEIGGDMMPAETSGSVTLKQGKAVIPVGTMKEPGFRDCRLTATVDGKSYKHHVKLGFSPEKIKPYTQMPKDFKEFWENNKAEAAKYPLTYTKELAKEYCTDKVDCYLIKLMLNSRGQSIYGYLFYPKNATKGSCPVVLCPPGAGIKTIKEPLRHKYYAEQGCIRFEIEIHGLNPTLTEEAFKEISNAFNGRENGYLNNGLDNRDNYYMKRVYLGCVRSIDLLTSLPEWDGKNVIVQGGSQGGALTLVTAALDSRVKYLAAFYPALCDIGGYAPNRAGGWFGVKELTPEETKVLAYYDVVNFARYIRIPGFYSWGYSDETCPPTSFYSAYNIIKAPKELYLLKETGHWRYPEQNIKVNQWLIDKLTGK